MLTNAEVNNTNALPGYHFIETLYEGRKTVVSRGVRLADNCPVAIKVLQQDYPTFHELLQFRNQYAIARNLDIPGIVRPYSLEPYRNSYALVMEDFDGVSLRDYAREHSLSVPRVLEIAVQVADILHTLHANFVIHKDIKPANILIHPQTQQVKLIDFSIASLLPKETQEIKNPNRLEGTLAYIAPEQTGRMNRAIDYRSDFYSLGVTLFELLAGELPFQSNDLMELVHCHIAKKSPFLTEIGVPEVIASIVAKLMAKNAEDRYQTAFGLKYDLEQCLAQLQETGKLENFELGTRDLCDRFIIPEKLYGREAETQALLDAFENVSQGTAELMLVAGYSGIGKTAVINEVHKPIVRERGYFIKGKFDQFNRNIPFSAFVQALRDLMGQLLSETNAQLETWKTKILEAVGENGQVIIEVIPELEQIIGKQPPIPTISGSAAQNRFNLLFEKFIQVFTTREHPLVLFLDDLQWADLASLNLLKLLMAENRRGYLLIFGAYRDNEVFPAHPLIVTLQEIEKSQARIGKIFLAPLLETTINQLVADTLSCREKIAEPLTQLIYQKTKGNPFFTTQFLKGLYEEGWIQFNADLCYWQCNLTAVRQLSLTDDVVEFMALQLQKLPAETQTLLKLAACIGNPFDLKTLAIVSEQEEVETASDLWKALQEGFILPINETYKFFHGSNSIACDLASTTVRDRDGAIDISYKFLHDRVQQAAYSLIPEVQKTSTHWKIGQLLYSGLSEQQQEEKIFALVNQLNLGKAAIANFSERKQLAQLNLQAAAKAKLCAAYQAARTYCEIGIALLPSEAWQTDYELLYALHHLGSEAAYLCSEFDRVETLYSDALAQARTPLDKATIYRVQMTQYQLQGRNAEAIAIQDRSLQLLGWSMPTAPEDIQRTLDEEISTVDRFLERHAIESILDFAKMEDDTIAEILRILQILFYAAWLDGQPTLALLALAKMTTLSLQYGNSDMSPFGYVGYGLIANALLKNAAQAYQFGSMAVQLCEQFDNADVRGMTNFLFAADVQSWSRPIREADTSYENALKYGMDAGNWLTVSFAMMQSGSDRLTYGKNLDDLHAIALAHAAFLRQIGSLENLDALIVGVLQPLRHLLGLTPSTASFDDDNFKEAEYLQKYSNTPYHLSWFYSVKIRHAYLFSQPELYPALIPKLQIIEETIASHAKVPSSVFYVILMHLTLIKAAEDEKQRQEHWQAIELLEERLNRWEKDCPENIRHKCLLIQAEKARLNGQIATAIDFYDRAIVQAKVQKYDYEEALTCELAAKFYLNWGKEKVAANYMQDAYYTYARWGAKAKTDDLEQGYANLLAPILRPATSLNSLETLASLTSTELSLHSLTATRSSSSSNFNATLDLTTVLKASQSVSGTLDLEQLIAQLSRIIIQHSGANRCALILPDAKEIWQVEARATTEEMFLKTEPLEGNPHLPTHLIYYVKNTREAVSLEDVKQKFLSSDPYLFAHKPKSVLVLPILNQGNLMGVLYLENQQAADAFTWDRQLVLNFLCTQAAISLTNARLYRQAQDYAQQLEQSQLQIVQSEKMASLGNLVAGIAHEINNPIGFLNGSVGNMKEHLQDLFGYLELYEATFPDVPDSLLDYAEDINFEFLERDCPKVLTSMQGAIARIKAISTSLRTFSRADSEHKVSANVHEGLDSTLLILKYRLKANDRRPAIEVVTDYGNLPEIECYPGQLNQVFMNLLANAIDALEEASLERTFSEIETTPNRIIIKTRLGKERAYITIADNGIGIPEALKTRIFDHLFTTKAVGKGTGLGLAIARQIIIEKHEGSLEVNSELGRGTEFRISLPL
ncbi:ATP-binding sensor histidine kinase [Oscillatoria sp. FACHB-1406]|uniref:trifunctional serine/threonine-protein kinase/ATP-binding protein/sensor histidine kinase n=1 Tax=Oscillatoria sp. FACHB-1406 TaxID=2692846 RepID=UPI001684F1EF|nr:ATP-binding sensor histidine kinase [Oscillatoria sp. FACHB-1406]MBD2578034.1 AAA family ATPase [Oscillatoria sp. FACHB-1406]